MADEAKVTELINEIKEGNSNVVQEEGEKLSRKERKRLYKDAVSGIDKEITVLEALLPKLPNSSEDYNQALAQIKSLTEARQILTKNHTEVSKAKWATAGTVGVTVAVMVFEFFKGPIIGTGSKLIHNK